MHIAIIGAGYVGLTTGACLAELGHKVYCVDNDSEKVALLKREEVQIPIYEPGLEGLIRKNKNERLTFTGNTERAVSDSQAVFICVGTPSNPDGSVDMTHFYSALSDITPYLNGHVVITKSTVPVGTVRLAKAFLDNNAYVASNPEFLREGNAVYDFMNPDRIVVGAHNAETKEVMDDIYFPIPKAVFYTTPESAELVKIASNTMLALEISFANALIHAYPGKNIWPATKIIKERFDIPNAFLYAGAGFGGSCFPKDVKGFEWFLKELGLNHHLINSVLGINERQRAYAVSLIQEKLGNISGRTIGVLGLAFKPGTDDMREAPSLDIIKGLQSLGAGIIAFDPKSMVVAKNIYHLDIGYASSPQEVVDRSDLVVLVTEWPEFKDLTIPNLFIDLRNHLLFSGQTLPTDYTGIGFGAELSSEEIDEIVNAFEGVVVSYAHLLEQVCTKTCANISDVLEGTSLDKRIRLNNIFAGYYRKPFKNQCIEDFFK